MRAVTRDTVAVAVVLGVPTLVAVIFTVVLAAMLAGVVYRPVAEIAPTVVLPPFTPFTAHTHTRVRPLAVSLNCWVWLAVNVTVAGEMVA
jgi:hypothetical protein